MIENICPKCDSDNVEFITFEGMTYLFCHECNYDQREEYESEFGGRIPGQLYE